MADSATTRYALVLPEVGASSDTWGSKLNNNFSDLDALTGAIATGGSANAYTLTTGLSLAAYASSQRFLVKWNHTNNASATLNVDGLGAKTIKRRDASTNCASGDLVSGAFGFVAYDGTNFVHVGVVATESQPLDATLTALAALSWSSGNALVQFTAADTVSLTLAPSVSSVTASQGAAATTPSGAFTNTNDNASVRALSMIGDRATPANNDNVYLYAELSNGAGTQFEAGEIIFQASSVTNGAETTICYFRTRSSGSSAIRASISGSGILPFTNGGIPLGVAGLAFSGLALSSGAVVNFNSGDVTITHSSNALEVAGGGFAAPLLPSSETSGTLTAASRNRKVNCTGNITLDDGVFAAEDWLVFDPGTSNRTFTRAAGLTMYVNGVDSASATLPANQCGGAIWRSSTVVVLTGPFT